MWSLKQQNLFHRAANLAGWNDQLRYVAMRAAGCPLIKVEPRHRSAPTAHSPLPTPAPLRPSIKSPGNTNNMFAAVMMLAESAAKQRGAGAEFPRPGDADSWAAASFDTAQRERHKARQIWAEARTKMPGVFFAEDGLDTFVRNQLAKDPAEFPGLFDHAPESLEECDLAQSTRIVESLKAWVGRKFYESGIRPQSFYTPSSAIRQVEAHRQRHRHQY